MTFELRRCAVRIIRNCLEPLSFSFGRYAATSHLKHQRLYRHVEVGSREILWRSQNSLIVNEVRVIVSC